MKVVIVGGVAGGASAAARIRRLDETAEILVFERSGFVSYANCGLPYYIGGVIQEQEELTLQTPESFWKRFRIDVRVRHEVTAIDPTAKTVTVHALETGKVSTETYDKLVLSPGAKPIVPGVVQGSWSGYSPCVLSRIRCASMILCRSTSPRRRCWPAEASSAWKWPKI